MIFICFFFSSRRRHTRWPRDWSSDVCSSDLARALLRFDEEVSAAVLGPAGFVVIGADRPLLTVGDDAHPVLRHTLADEIIHRSEERRVGKEGRVLWV